MPPGEPPIDLHCADWPAAMDEKRNAVVVGQAVNGNGWPAEVAIMRAGLAHLMLEDWQSQCVGRFGVPIR